MADLRNRPLRDTALDRRRFIGRDADVEAVLRSVSLRFNVLLVAERGAGLSSFMAHLPRAADACGHDLPPFRFVQASRADSRAELLGLVASILEGRAPMSPGAEEEALDALTRAAAHHGPAAVLVDGLSGRLAHGVFGRMRDELWSLADLGWIVGVPADEEPLARTPPADQFFETVHRLGPLSADEIVEMLRRRGADEELDDQRLELIAAASRGSPSTALRLARASLVGPGREDLRTASDVVDEIRDRLGEPAARLAAELSQAGSAGPSDEALLRRLGWSRPRAYEVFRQLEQHGYADVALERTGQPGRPRKVFRLRETIG